MPTIGFRSHVFFFRSLGVQGDIIYIYRVLHGDRIDVKHVFL